VEEEMALTVTDLFARRASLFYWTEDGGLSVGDAVADEMGRLLGWSAEQRTEQLSDYRRWVAANRFVAVLA
jgi:glycerol-3-phosphate dehydrogenase